MTTQASALAGGYNPPGGQEVAASARQTELMAKWTHYFQRPFGPNAPLVPRYGADAQAGTPRTFQYPVGINLRYLPRGDFGFTPFDQLLNLAAFYDVAAMCIDSRTETILAGEWSIAPKDKNRKDLDGETQYATKFWSKPDQRHDYASWMTMAIYDMFAIDALTIYPRPNRGGDLYALELIDGATVKPLLDDEGRTSAYQQIIWGYPLTDYQRAFEGNDPKAAEKFPTYSAQELIYRRRWMRTRSPYGFPPTEKIVLRINTALRKQTFDLAYFTDGNIPDMMAWPPEGALNPEEVKKFEDWFNAVLEGSDTARRKMRFLPWPANVKELKPYSYSKELDEWMFRLTCAMFGVAPQELGITEGVNRSSAEFQENLTMRRGFKPLANWFKILFDQVNADYMPHAALKHALQQSAAVSVRAAPTRRVENPFNEIKWVWNTGESEDKLMSAQVDAIYMTVQKGQNQSVVSPTEVRKMRFGESLEGDAPMATGPLTNSSPKDGDGSSAGTGGSSQQVNGQSGNAPDGVSQKPVIPPGAKAKGAKALANKTMTRKIATADGASAELDHALELLHEEIPAAKTLLKRARRLSKRTGE